MLLKIISASRALAQLNGALINLPNPRLFIDTIHLQEARASSEIESIITTNDDLYRSITKRQFLIAAGLGSPKTVGNYLHDLEEKKYLKSIKIGKEKLYLNYQLMEILETK